MKEDQRPYDVKEELPLQLINPSGLYDRDEEMLEIRKAIDMLNQGESVCVDLSGESGVGKSFLKQMAFSELQNIHVFTFSFNSRSKNKPYHLLNELLEELFHFLKEMKNDHELSSWYQQINPLVENLPQDVRKSIPFLFEMPLKYRKGKSGSVSPATAKKMLESFYVAYACALFEEIDRKFVLAVDNLHLYEHDTMKLLFKIFNRVNSPVMIVLSGRFGEWQELRQQFLTKEDELKRHYYAVELADFTQDKVAGFIEFILGGKVNEVHELARLFYDTTSGNPKSILETIRTLINDKKVFFDRSVSIWKWDVDPGLFKSKMSIVNLFSKKYEELTDVSKEVLHFCACLGVNITPALVAKLTRLNLDQANAILNQCWQEGFIDREPVSTLQGNQSKGNYHFSSEDVAAVIHNSMDDGVRQKNHRSIANYLLKRSAIGVSERDVFEAVTHLNRSLDLKMTEDERKSYVRLNVQAAKKSRFLTSFEGGYEYVKKGCWLAEELSWEAHREELTDLYKEAYQLARLNGDSAGEREYMSVAMSQFDKEGIYEIRFVKMVLDIQFGMLNEGLQTGVQILADLGFRVKPNASKLSVLLEFLRTRRMLRKKTIDEIYALPQIKDPRLDKIFQVIFWLFRASQYIAPELNGVLALKQLQLMLKHGTNGEAWSGLMAYGVIIGAGMNDYKTAFEYADLGGRLAEKYGNDSGKVAFGKAIYWPFKHPLSETLDIYALSKSKQYREGDYIGAAEATVNESLTHVSLGRSLDDVIQKVADNFEFCDAVSALDFKNFQQNLRLNLEHLKLGSESLPKSNDIDQSTEFAITRSVDLIVKLNIAFLKEDYVQALDWINKGRGVVGNLTGLYFKTEYDFYSVLTYLSLIRSGSGSFGIKRKVRKLIRNFEKWSESAPANYEHKRCLISGVELSVKGDFENASKALERAVELSKELQNLPVQAIALSELAKNAKMQSNQKKAQEYDQASSDAFRRWGLEWK